MSFVLKNALATYLRMTNKAFKEEIGEPLQTYMDDMIVKSNEKELHDKYLAHVFQRVW